MQEIKNITNIFNLNKKCTHYESNLKVYAKCCNEYFDCHLCHNDIKDHKMNRKTINKVLCIKCNTENKLTNECSNCNIQFGKNFCNICNIWCSKKKDRFHCNSCGICRIGKREDYFHCDKCKLCLSISCKNNHDCGKINTNNDCPICLDPIFNRSTDKIMLLDCNHIIHENCLKNYVNSVNKNKKIPCCVLCKKSVVKFLDYEKKFDEELNKYPMPEFYKSWKSNISCNDCRVNSQTKYHNTYHKCNNCKSYNTTLVDILKKI